MAQVSITIETEFPWTVSKEDRFFRRLAIIILTIFMIGGLILNSLTLPQLEQQQLIDISPRLAKLILEKQKKIVPPTIKEMPKTEQKIEKKLDKKKVPEKEKKKPVKEKTPTAREVAQQSGLIAFSEELSELSTAFNVDSVSHLPLQTTGKKAIEVATTSDLLTSQAKKSSTGISTSNLSDKVQSSELATRKTTAVKSKIQSKPETKKKIAARSASGAKRSADEIERVFQKNKGAIFAIYNRALRKNPFLEGKVVVELTIASNGNVISVKILSSELDDKTLERKLALKIKKFKFAKTDLPQIIVTYPIDFLPT